MIKSDNIYLFIKNLDSKSFLKYTYILIGIVSAIFGLILYRHFTKVAFLKKEIKKVNIARQDAQIILSKYMQVKKQKEVVDQIIEKSKNFKLIDFFDSITKKNNIFTNIKSREISTNDLENLTSEETKYSEVLLNTNIDNVNMKQLVELLNDIERTERVYTKSLSIKKNANNRKIDVNIIIATIQPKSELAEIVE